ncbi:MAG: hypothetical protein A2Y10_05125 [Planctomycetes bacterium GWF2_41_51]|nr:MAG: hypothetical protein A2Y10_05125 [Planctomycetes bacterium GWF2_41_51]HBG25553.1 hypothetical protein [Phycisphaerales bacterium]
MDNFVLVKDPKYEGGYVAFTSVTDHTIVASGKTRKEVREKAKKFSPNPMVFFVPAKDLSFCF